MGGMALFPSAGVAIGMERDAIERPTDCGESILPVVIASTVLFAVVGPIFTRRGIVRAGEAHDPWAKKAVIRHRVRLLPCRSPDSGNFV